MKLNFLQSDSKKPEWIDYALFIVLFAVVSVFHEPWFDEAEAWQIAKCASLREILLTIPHYEGHPPLWHLLLALPAKLGVPFEVGVKAVASIPTLLSVWLLLFRSPFPRPIRLILPYHYFVFYQYGVVSRPYGLMLLAFLLSAISFQEKDAHPWRFMLCMLFLCLTSAYGIVLAGGICICWVLEILKEYRRKHTGCLFRDPRFAPLAVLLVLALILILQILPRSDTYATDLEPTNPFPLRVIYLFFCLLPDSLFMTILSTCENLLFSHLVPLVLIPASIVGLFLYGVLILISAPRKRIYFFIPFFMFAGFSALVYFYSHHIGIAALYLLFWLWINHEDETRGQAAHAIVNEFESVRNARRMIQKASFLLLAAILIVPMVWTATASVNDILHPYNFSRDTAEFLRQTGLSDTLILSDWDSPRAVNSNKKADYFEQINTNHPIYAAQINAYFSHNIISNLNGGSDRYAYITHIRPSRDENIQNLSEWKKNGYPDVMIGSVPLELIFQNDTISLADYAPVYRMDSTSVSIWKCTYVDSANYNYIYLRRDLLEQYGLEEIEADPYYYPYAYIKK